MKPQKNPVLIVEARFYDDIADELSKGALSLLLEEDIPYRCIQVPGVFEIPAAITLCLQSPSPERREPPYGGAIALGCVIRGQTDHYDHICREASRALMDITVLYSLAFGFGVLTCHSYGQALERASRAGQNKGREAANACIHMMKLKHTLMSEMA